MRLFIIMFLFAVGVMRAADSYSQNVLLDIEVQNQTIEKVLGEIEKQSEFTFFYNDKQINVNRLVSVTVTKETIFKVLDKIFKDTGISYSILDKSIILSNRKANINVGLENKKINGTVFDAKGEPIIGANVRVKGSTLGTITDLDGVFSLDVPENAILEVSYIGYESQTVHVADKTQFSFILKEDTEVLEDVVVIGYGSVKKSNLTGAVASVKMEEVPQTATTEVSNLLIGRVPGLSIRQNSAAPDGDYKMVIRGSASTNAENIPLYVIDGFPGGDINAVNPNDIESIEVLKDGDTVVFDSVSRMSRNAEEGFSLYEDLYHKGVRLVFLKEHHIDTETYKKALSGSIAMTGTNVDFILKGINEYLMALAKEQIKLAFEQSEKEVADLHQRTREGLVTAKLNGKQVGRKKGAGFETKKSKAAKEKIRIHCKAFGGTLDDVECMKLTGLARNTYYKYKRQIRAGLADEGKT